MKHEDTRSAVDLYERALDLEENERKSFVERECVGRAELKRMVQLMLSASEAPEFLEPDVVPTADVAAKPEVLQHEPVEGQRVGPFRLLRTIGFGGMGVVYEAEQDFPQRRVALKRLRADVLLNSSARRFRSEIELLARLDHPGVARIHEAGVHVGADGIEQPYFAMEFVEDARDLLSWSRERPLLERLGLFVEVCDAVQHGHQRGVIHRDLKPQNVLVGRGDAVKVIDFGVARAVDAESSAATRATGAGELIGTLSYMAPEQIAGEAHEVDTRTDVYALGLMLFELAYSTPPYDLHGKPLTEVVRIIREVAPLSPTRLERGAPRDLGWIALKALEKDPDQRYPSVSELAGDVRRFLENRPVEAGPPSRLTTLRKFVQRNKLAVSAAMLVLTSIAVGGAVSFSAMVRAQTENDKFQSINEVLTDMLVAVRAEEDGYDVRAADLLDRAAAGLARFEDRPEVEAPMRCTLAKSYLSLGLAQEAEAQARRALALRGFLTGELELQAAGHLGQALLSLDHVAEAREIVSRYLPAATPRESSSDSVALFPLRQLDAQLLRREGEPSTGIERLRSLVSDSRRVHGGDSRSTRNYELSLFDALFEAQRFSEASDLVTDLGARTERLDGARNETTLVVRSKQARLLAKQGEHKASARLQEALVPGFVAVFGENSSRTLVALNDLANTYILQGENLRALPILEEIVRIREQRDGPQHSETLIAKSSLAVALAGLGDGRAEALRQEGFETRRNVLGPDHPETLRAQLALCRYLRQAGRLQEAEPLLVDLQERSLRVYLDDDLALHDAAAELAMLLLSTERVPEAIELLGQAWRGYQRRAGPAESITQVHGNNYATALMHLQRWEEAQLVLTEVLAQMRERLAADDPRQLGPMYNLAIVYGKRGESARCELGLREALAWSQAHLPVKDPRRIHMQSSLADHLAEQARYDEALVEYEEALVATELNSQLEPKEHAALRLGYARSLRAISRFAEAAFELELVLEMERARLGPESEQVLGLRAEYDAVREDAAQQGD